MSDYDLRECCYITKTKVIMPSADNGWWSLALDLYALISTKMGIIILTYFIMGED